MRHFHISQGLRASSHPALRSQQLCWPRCNTWDITLSATLHCILGSPSQKTWGQLLAQSLSNVYFFEKLGYQWEERYSNKEYSKVGELNPMEGVCCTPPRRPPSHAYNSAMQIIVQNSGDETPAIYNIIRCTSKCPFSIEIPLKFYDSISLARSKLWYMLGP